MTYFDFVICLEKLNALGNEEIVIVITGLKRVIDHVWYLVAGFRHEWDGF